MPRIIRLKQAGGAALAAPPKESTLDWKPSAVQGSQHSYERLMGALAASDASAHVLEEARRALVEARFLLLSPPSSHADPVDEAVAVLERGIRDAEYALNITEDPGE